MSRRKNYWYVITRLRSRGLIAHLKKKKNTEAATAGAEAVTGDVLLKISQTSVESTCVGDLFYEAAGLQVF